MLKNWKIAYKVMLMPVLAAVAFLVIVILTPRWTAGLSPPA